MSGLRLRVAVMKSLLLSCAMCLMLLTACSDGGGIGDNTPIDPNGASYPPLATTTPSSASPIQPDASPSPARTPRPAQDVASLIPAGWNLLNDPQNVIAEGDLNRDGIPDVAMVIERAEGGLEAPRSLLIAFGTKENTYSLSILAEHVILSAWEGGVFGDPFSGLSIDRGSVVVSDYGGSSTKWYHTYRFRFQDNDWYLIGATMGTIFPISEELGMGVDEDDYNLLTGDYISKRTNKAGAEEVTKGNRGKKPLVKLGEFDITNI